MDLRYSNMTESSNSKSTEIYPHVISDDISAIKNLLDYLMGYEIRKVIL